MLLKTITLLGISKHRNQKEISPRVQIFDSCLISGHPASGRAFRPKHYARALGVDKTKTYGRSNPLSAGAHLPPLWIRNGFVLRTWTNWAPGTQPSPFLSVDEPGARYISMLTCAAAASTTSEEYIRRMRPEHLNQAAKHKKRNSHDKVRCDTCGMVRSPGQQDWILGYDLMLDTPQTVSRSISFFDTWDDSRILQRGAIHFCSPECKQAYVAANSVNKRMPATRTSRRKMPRKSSRAA